VVIRIAGAADVAALAQLRARWSDTPADVAFERRMADWLASEGERRTTWLATLDGQPVGMASMLEYRRMPRPGRDDSRWGYVGNMFVREQARDRGIGSKLLNAIIATAEQRGYVRLVLSPSERALAFYRRAGFMVPDAEAGGDRLLVRPTWPPGCSPRRGGTSA
jgi:GNAT superfamily N-acetyltransferase